MCPLRRAPLLLVVYYCGGGCAVWFFFAAFGVTVSQQITRFLNMAKSRATLQCNILKGGGGVAYAAPPEKFLGFPRPLNGAFWE